MIPMQSKDITSKPLDTEWAIIKWNATVRKDVKASGLVHWESLEKVTLVSTDRYEVDKTKRSYDPDDALFVRKADPVKGSFGYLIKGEGDPDSNDPTKPVYRVVPASDFISPWADQATHVEEQRNEQQRIIKEQAEARVRQQIISEENDRRQRIAREVALDRAVKANETAKAFMLKHIPADMVEDMVDFNFYSDVTYKPSVDGIHLDYTPNINGVINMRAEVWQTFMQVFMDLQND